MNEQLEEYARATIKSGLSRLNDNHHELFKRMYSPNNLTADINDVVDRIDTAKLDWAMQQVQRTLDEISGK